MGQFSNPVATHPRTNEVEVPPRGVAIHNFMFLEQSLVVIVQNEAPADSHRDGEVNLKVRGLTGT